MEERVGRRADRDRRNAEGECHMWIVTVKEWKGYVKYAEKEKNAQTQNFFL